MDNDRCRAIWNASCLDDQEPLDDIEKCRRTEDRGRSQFDTLTVSALGRKEDGQKDHLVARKGKRDLYRHQHDNETDRQSKLGCVSLRTI